MRRSRFSVQSAAHTTPLYYSPKQTSVNIYTYYSAALFTVMTVAKYKNNNKAVKEHIVRTRRSRQDRRVGRSEQRTTKQNYTNTTDTTLSSCTIDVSQMSPTHHTCETNGVQPSISINQSDLPNEKSWFNVQWLRAKTGENNEEFERQEFRWWGEEMTLSTARFWDADKWQSPRHHCLCLYTLSVCTVLQHALMCYTMS